jgi:hypothetical protein
MRNFNKVHEWALYRQIGILVTPITSAVDVYTINRLDKVVYPDLHKSDTYEVLQ